MKRINKNRIYYKTIKARRKRNPIYLRICKHCGKPFETEAMYGKVCDICKQQNRKKIQDGYYKKYLEKFGYKYKNERRLKKNELAKKKK